MGNSCCSCGDEFSSEKDKRQHFIRSGAALLNHIFVTGHAQRKEWLNRFFAEFSAALESSLGISGIERNDLVSECFEEKALLMPEARIFLRQQWKNFMAINTPVEVDSSRVMIVVGWLRFDRDRSGTLEKGEIESVVSWLNLDAMSTKALNKRIAQCLKSPHRTNNKSLNFAEFSDLFDELVVWFELDFVFEKATMPPRMQAPEEADAAKLRAMQDATEDGELISFHQLGEFLFYVQHEGDRCWSLAKRILKSASRTAAASGRSSHALDKASFYKYLTNRELNCIIDLDRTRQVYQEMHHTLPSYFISCSHNTYVVDGQLRGESSADMYRRALLSGCRSVELDVWDGPNGQPIVYHGYTLMTKISFESVIDAIAETAFATSDYPVSLSLDLNISPEQQIAMVRIMKAKLGGAIQPPAWYGGDSTVPTEHAILDRLRGKILVKAKRIAGPPKGDEEVNVCEVDEDELREVQERQATLQLELQKQGADKKAAPQHQQHPHLKPMARELSDLVWMEARPFKNFNETTRVALPHECTSFHENTSMSYIKTDMARYREYNKRRLSRIYPSGARVDSSNFHPQPHWNAGCSMCAMNIQDKTASSYCFRLYRSRFMDNGGCGYVLKPEWLRVPGMVQPPARQTQITVKLSVLSGFALPKPDNDSRGEIVDPYVRVIVEGPGFDNEQAIHETQVIDDNGFHPVFYRSHDDDVTVTVPVPELSTLVFQVLDKDVVSSDLLAEAFVPMHLMRTGVRCVPLETPHDDTNPDVHARTSFLMVVVDIVAGADL